MSTKASVAVAFVGIPPQGNFRKALVNISGVRINKTLNATAFDAGWVTIAVPSGVGGGNGQNPGDLQIDLLNSLTGATFFNVGGVPQGTYNTVQVLVDPTLPGLLVPACQAGVSNTEGCINYHMQFDTTSSSQNIVLFNLSSPLTVNPNATSPLVIQLAISITSQPILSGDPYLVNINAGQANAVSFLGEITGSTTIKWSSSSGQKTSPSSVSAELSGTSTVIETALVKAKGVYTLELPAAPGGTSYDIFTSGGGAAYATVQNITIVPGLSVTENLTPKGGSPTTFAGTISDGCTGVGIPGAQLEILAPNASTDLPTPQPTPPATGSCLANPSQCVVVAATSTDQSGNYPLPGTTLQPALFSQVPANFANMAVRVSASGYSSLLSSVFIKGAKNQICSASSANPSTICNFSLATGYINGTANLVSDPPPGNSVMVEVFAEYSGTNQIVSALPQPIVFKNQQTSLPFTLNVPVSDEPGQQFDLFAVAIDPYVGATEPFPGHDITVLAQVPAPSAPCAFEPPEPTPLPTPPALMMPAMDCVGHGSITGTVQNPDTNTTVEVEKQGVQLLGTAPGLFSSSSPGGNNQYTLCVPPDDYVLQRFEALPTSTAEPTDVPTPMATPVGPPQPITVPQPESTSSPCPSTCSNQSTSTSPCPGLCNATAASPL